MAEIEDYEKDGTGEPETTSRSSPVWGIPHANYEGPKFSLCHYFDYICGSRMGGLFAMMIGVQNLALEEAIRLAEDIIRTGIQTAKTPCKFPLAPRLTRRRNSKILCKALKSLPPTWKRSLETKEGMCRTVIFATHRLDRWMREQFTLRSYHEPKEISPNGSSDTRQIPLIDICKVTLSGDNFEPIKIDGLSGCFQAAKFDDADSALEAYEEVTIIHEDTLDLLVSIGRTPDIVRDDSMYERSRKRGFDLWMISDSVDGNIEQIALRAKEFCDDNREEIRMWAKTLVKRRRLKARDYRWKKFVGRRRSRQIWTKSDSDGDNDDGPSAVDTLRNPEPQSIMGIIDEN